MFVWKKTLLTVKWCKCEGYMISPIWVVHDEGHDAVVFPEDGLVVELVEVVAPDPVVGVGSQDVLVITPVARTIQVCSITTFSSVLLFCNCLANHAMIWLYDMIIWLYFLSVAFKAKYKPGQTVLKTCIVGRVVGHGIARANQKSIAFVLRGPTNNPKCIFCGSNLCKKMNG